MKRERPPHDPVIDQFKSNYRRYVLGFIYNVDMETVALVRKIKPKWQEGKLNGIGGHVEEDESFSQAMNREGYEEVGYQGYWIYNGKLYHVKWEMYVFSAVANLDHIPKEIDTGESIEIHSVRSIANLSVIPNLKWLIPLCIDNEVTFTISDNGRN